MVDPAHSEGMSTATTAIDPSQIAAGTYFISHSYRDRIQIKSLTEALPSQARPFLFAAIDCSPLEFVSNTLIGSILTCDGLIYLRSKWSDNSFWVAFEREFALRAGKPIFAYRWHKGCFERVVRRPLDLKLFFSAAVEDYPRLKDIKTFMSTKRFFDFTFPHEEMPGASSDVINALFSPGATKLNAKVKRHRRALANLWSSDRVELILSNDVFNPYAVGNIVVFWSKHSPSSKCQKDDLRIAQAIVRNALSRAVLSDHDVVRTELMATLNRRVLFVRLDETPLPEWATDAVQLFGDDVRSELNRIDDLIVALYWKFVSKADFHEGLRDSEVH